jgi:hypothetical protein
LEGQQADGSVAVAEGEYEQSSRRAAITESN